MPSPPLDLERELAAVADPDADPRRAARLADHGQALLPALAACLIRDLPIAILERYEELYKAVLRRAFAGPLAPEQARGLAHYQREIGLLLKYKSYAVKASSPLGYSLFLQEPRQGFSFQRHPVHKIEVFHILDALDNGFVFLCSYAEWLAVYQAERFTAWLAGEIAAPEYERFRYPAHPGDVFVLDQLGHVHTVIGCILEEFATVSTDMVERLHDQNVDRTVPEHFSRSWTYTALARVPAPATSRRVLLDGRERGAQELPPSEQAGVARTVLADDFVQAVTLQLARGAAMPPAEDARLATSLYVRSGRGRLLLGSAPELARTTPPGIPIGATDLVLIAPGASYALVNEGDEPLSAVLHGIAPDVALVAP